MLVRQHKPTINRLVCVWACVRVCKSYQSVTDVTLSISSCVHASRVYLYTTLLLLVQIRLARTS